MEQIVFHNDDFDRLKELVNKTAIKNLFLVIDKASYELSGAKKFIGSLIDKDIQITSFDDFSTNPKLSDLERGISLFRRGTFELVIAIGGGSTLDMAKLISVFGHQKEKYEDLVKGKRQIIPRKTAVLAIPTTAGSGAEATQFAVLYIDKTKYSVENPLIKPDFVFLSSLFTISASPYLIACTGLDAFCQAIESIWSIHSNSESESLAIKAAQIVWHNLHEAFISQNITAREEMQEAAYLAGKAINIAKTTAPHALSYAFTGFYSIPHGHAVALSLPFFLNYNYYVTQQDCNDKRGPDSVKERIDRILTVIDSSIDEAPGVLMHFFNSIHISISLQTINDFNPSFIIDNVNLQRLGNNPRKVTAEAIADFLKGGQ